MEFHKDECKEGETRCDKCDMTIKIKDKVRHLDECTEVEIKCEKCNTEIRRKDLQGHDCVEALLALLVEKEQVIREKDQVIFEKESIIKEKDIEFGNMN